MVLAFKKNEVILHTRKPKGLKCIHLSKNRYFSTPFDIQKTPFLYKIIQVRYLVVPKIHPVYIYIYLLQKYNLNNKINNYNKFIK